MLHTCCCSYSYNYICCVFISAEGKPLSKKAVKKQQKEAEKSKRKAETSARLVRLKQTN